jgi:hypothetical protein
MKNYLRFHVAIKFILICLVTCVAAQSDWRQTPYQQWTLGEVEKLLSDSPWALTRARERINDPAPSRSTFDAGSMTVRLRSALPVRQALVRLRQIRGKYDKMGESEKASFDNKQKVLLECPGCADNYVVSLSPPFDRPSGVPTTLREIAFATVKRHVQLANESGETRELVHFEPPKAQGGEAVFFFARFDDKGKPLLTSANKKLIISIDPQIFRTNISVPMKFEFDVSKMMLNDALLF